MADAVKDLLKRGQAKDAAVLIDETEEKTIDASSAEYEEDGYGEIYVECNYSPEDFGKLRYLARSEDKEARKEFFEDCRKAASEGDLKDVWLKNYTSPEERSIQLKTILEQIELKYIREYCSLYGTLEKTAEKLYMNLKTLSRRKKHLEEKYPRSETL